MSDGGVPAAKSAPAPLREQIGRPVRRSGSMARRCGARSGCRPAGRAARVVACYLSVGAEPGTGPLLEALAAIGVRTIVPVLTPDDDLDWAAFAPGEPTVRGRRRTIEPMRPPLGMDAVRDADVVVVPALAVDRRGGRLGRGGGSFDRVLARVAAKTPVLAVVHDDEVLDEVPTEPHDRAVSGALTPSGPLFFTARDTG